MEVRRFAVHDAVGEDPRPANCVRCGGGPVDATEGCEVCRECGTINGTGISGLKRGFTFIVRRSNCVSLSIDRERHDDHEKRHLHKYVFRIG